ncbi:hypothetical protein SELMODRAFT_411408 [Selaginella moellendorffii]|uniref:Uncharacterized protein n=1 Tax=Selaginella moellendorffii TaxID=88036 RepID=D8RHU1_SELML|nr:hypothetical protein SELMODRAFT_411408 [Selaginella moellendorffii]
MADFPRLAEFPAIGDMVGHTRDMLSIEHVTVVGNLHWEKMQSLLQVLCTQIQAQTQELNKQALQLSKVEHHEKHLADLQAELDDCKRVMKGYEEDRANDAEKQNFMMDALKLFDDQENRTKNLETQLATLQDELAASILAMRDLTTRVSLIEQELAPLKPLPQRMDALEGNMKKLNAATANLQQSFRAVDFGRIAKLSSMMGKQGSPVQDVSPEPKVELIQPDFESAQLDELGNDLDSLNSMFSKQNKHLNNLETQIEQLMLLIQQLTKVHTADFETLRKSYAGLRQEIDSKPLLAPHVPVVAPADIDACSRLEAILAEFQNRLSRKAEEDAVSHVANDVQRMKDLLEQMGITMNAFRRRASSLAIGGPMLDSMEIRLKKAEENLVTMDSNKADRSRLDAIELKFSLLGPGDPKAVTNAAGIQSLTDILMKKADRSDLVDVRKMLQAQASRTPDDDIRRLFEAIDEIKGLMVDRTALLLPSTPFVPDTSSVLNDHAAMLSKHNDLLSHFEERLEKKADQASFLFLKDLMDSLKQHRKTRAASFSSNQSLKQFADETSILHQMLTEVTTTLNDHERVLQQLTQGVLIMSGHDDDEEIHMGIVSTFQPQLEEDEASELSRPSTRSESAVTRVEPVHDPTATSTFNHEPQQTMATNLAVQSAMQVAEMRYRVPVEIVETRPARAPDRRDLQREKSPRPAVNHAPTARGFSQPQALESVSSEPEPGATGSRVLESRENHPVSRGENLENHQRIQGTAEVALQPTQAMWTELIIVQRSEPTEETEETVNQSLQTHTREVAGVLEGGPTVESRQDVSSSRVAENRVAKESRSDGIYARVAESKAAVHHATSVRDAVESGSAAVVESRLDPPSVPAPNTPVTSSPLRATPDVLLQSQEPDVATSGRAQEFANSRARDVAPVYATSPDAPHHRAQHIMQYSAPDILQIVYPARAPDISQTRGQAPDIVQIVSAPVQVACHLDEREDTQSRDNFVRNVNPPASGEISTGAPWQSKELRNLLSSMELLKADKQAMEELWQFVRANLTENAMFTGKPLIGFKCMSCEHSIEKLHPFRSDYLPTNMMPKQWLSMFTADRLFNNEKRDEKLALYPNRSPSPPRTNASSPFPKANTPEQPAGGTTPPGNRAEAPTNQTLKAATSVHLGPKVASIAIRK